LDGDNKIIKSNMGSVKSDWKRNLKMLRRRRK
jgi:hypothetical protein